MLIKRKLALTVLLHTTNKEIFQVDIYFCFKILNSVLLVEQICEYFASIFPDIRKILCWAAISGTLLCFHKIELLGFKYWLTIISTGWSENRYLNEDEYEAYSFPTGFLFQWRLIKARGKLLLHYVWILDWMFSV